MWSLDAAHLRQIFLSRATRRSNTVERSWNNYPWFAITLVACPTTFALDRFGSFEAHVCNPFHQTSCKVKVLNAFRVISSIRDTYERATTTSTIRSGSSESGIWNPLTHVTDSTHVAKTPFFRATLSCEMVPTVAHIVQSFQGCSRSLLNDTAIQESTIRLDKKRGAHVTSPNFLAALRDGKHRRNSVESNRISRESARWERLCYPESVTKRCHLVDLAEAHSFRRQQFQSSRAFRWAVRAAASEVLFRVPGDRGFASWSVVGRK